MAGDRVIRCVAIAGWAGTVDISVEDGGIAAIEPAAEGDGICRVVLPGLVDLHTHLREPGGEAAETIATGTAAAAAGGFTDVFAMANTDPATDTVRRVRDIRARAAGAAARVYPVAAVTRGLAGRKLTDFPALAADGVTMFSDDGKCVTDSGMVRETLAAMAEYGTVFAQHAQDTALVGGGVVHAAVAERASAPGWPSAGEERIVERDIALAAETGGPLHVCHVSTARTVDLIRQAKRENLPVTAEVTPHHLMLTDEDALRAGPRLKVNPPLRSAADRAALLDGLRDGTIDAIGTDHAPHPAAAKAGTWTSAAFGLTALETALPLLIEVFTRESDMAVDWASVLRLMSHTPARIGRIERQAGRPVRPGEPATLTVIAQVGGRVHAQQHRSLSRNTPFEGRPLSWRVETTLVEGRTTYSGRP